MNWKRQLLMVVMCSTLFFALSTLIRGKASNFSSQDHTLDAAECIAFSFFFIGNEELRRGGHRRALRVLGGCLVIWFAIDLILFGIAALCKTTMLDLVTRYTLYPLWLTFAAPFPFAIYLNRNQQKFTPQPPSANES